MSVGPTWICPTFKVEQTFQFQAFNWLEALPDQPMRTQVSAPFTNKLSKKRVTQSACTSFDYNSENGERNEIIGSKLFF